MVIFLYLIQISQLLDWTSRTSRLTCSILVGVSVIFASGAVAQNKYVDAEFERYRLAQEERKKQAEIKQKELEDAWVRALHHSKMSDIQPSVIYEDEEWEPEKHCVIPPEVRHRVYSEFLSQQPSRSGLHLTNNSLRTRSEFVSNILLGQSRRGRSVQALGLDYERLPDWVQVGLHELESNEHTLNQRSAVTLQREGEPFEIPLILPASDPAYTSLVYLDNVFGYSTSVEMYAIDDAGYRVGPLAIELEPYETVRFTSADLESGGGTSSVDGHTGVGIGSWRLILYPKSSIIVRSYIEDQLGVRSPMFPAVQPGSAPYEIKWFDDLEDTDSSQTTASLLRVINDEDDYATFTIVTLDERGDSIAEIELPLEPQNSLTLSTDDILSNVDSDFSGSASTYSGFHSLRVESDHNIRLMHLLRDSQGRLANLSSAAQRVHSNEFIVPLVAPDASTANEVRMHLTGSEQNLQKVAISGFQNGTLQGTHEWELSENGELVLGVSDILNTLNISTRRLGPSPLILSVHSEYAIHVVTEPVESGSTAIPVPKSSTHEVSSIRIFGFFEPLENSDLDPHLFLHNLTAQPAKVELVANDRGIGWERLAQFDLPPNLSRLISGRDLYKFGESFPATSTPFRDLLVRTNSTVLTQSFMGVAGDRISNVTNSAMRLELTDDSEPTAEDQFNDKVSDAVIQDNCIECHKEGGLADGNTNLLFVPDTQEDHLTANLQTIRDFVNDPKKGADLILQKVQGNLNHGGGRRFTSDEQEYKDLQKLLELIEMESDDSDDDGSGDDVIVSTELFDNILLASDRQTLRRAAILVAGRIPTEQEYSALETGEVSLQESIRNLMEGSSFHDFLIRNANDRLLTERGDEIFTRGETFPRWDNEQYRLEFHRRNASSEDEAKKWEYRRNRFQKNARHAGFRAPLELIAHVVMNDLQYTEILTADYMMANEHLKFILGASDEYSEISDPLSLNPIRIEEYYAACDGQARVCDNNGCRTLDPGPCRVDYPHAGVLNTTVFLQRYPTTPTNRNRARARWTYYHFLGEDIEASAPRTTDAAALADRFNPTMHNPACTVCHQRLDPVAGTFQNYGNEGLYRDRHPGDNALDDNYKEPPGPGEEIEDSFNTYETTYKLTKRFKFNGDDESIQIAVLSRPHDWQHSYVIINKLILRDEHGNEVYEGGIQELVASSACGHRYVIHEDDAIDAYFLQQRCPLDVEIPVAVEKPTEFDVELEVWILDKHEQANTSVRMEMDYYRQGDTWYRDMRPPGFNGRLAPNSDTSVRWLAHEIVKDDRFAEAAVEFWWPAIMGSEVVSGPEHVDDADYEQRRVEFDAQQIEVRRLANGFRNGFQPDRPYNAKDLLVEIFLSKWFRATTYDEGDSQSGPILRKVGSARLLTPEELDVKTAAITGYQWGRHYDNVVWREPREWERSELSRNYALLYGSIDSDGITTRTREMSSLMSAVAQLHATHASCPIAFRELYLLPEDKKRLFDGYDRSLTPTTEIAGGSTTIKNEVEDGQQTVTYSGSIVSDKVRLRISFTNNAGSMGEDRNLYVDKIVLRDAQHHVVQNIEIEDVDWAENQAGCDIRRGSSHATFYCNGTLGIDLSIDQPGEYEIDILAWGSQVSGIGPTMGVTIDSLSNQHDTLGARAIKAQLVQLLDRMLGVETEDDSAVTKELYTLFLNLWAHTQQYDDHGSTFPGKLAGRNLNCEYSNDYRFLEGIVDPAYVCEEKENDPSYKRCRFDWPIWNDVSRNMQFDDPQGISKTWVSMLTSLLMDYRYLHL